MRHTRKAILLAILAGLLAPALIADAPDPGAAAKPKISRWESNLSAGAQSPRTQSPLGLYVNIAYINLGTPPRWMAFGPELEWRAGRLVTFNPDVSLWFPDTLRGAIRIVPGLTVNLRFDRVFFGGGVVGRVSEWGIDTDSWIVPKLQFGLLTGRAKIALTIHIPGGGNDVAFGFTIGTRVGRPGRREPD